MTREELMKKHNLYGPILEPALYYWERVGAAIDEAFLEGQLSMGLDLIRDKFEKAIREEFKPKTWQERFKEMPGKDAV